MKIKTKLSIVTAFSIAALAFSGCGSKETGEQAAIEESQIKMEENSTRYHELQSALHNKAEIGDGVITFTDEDYLDKMETILCNIDDYIGREINYTGTISVVHGSEEDVHVLGRNIDSVHGDHTHEGIVGLALIYDGAIPKEGTEAEVTGILEVQGLNGAVVPVIKVSELKTEK